MLIDMIFGILYLLTMTYTLAQDPVANLAQGRIVGIKVYTESSLTPVEIYFGIPYAIPPIGRYRFSATERHTGWKRRTFFAHRMPPHCPHEGDDQSKHSSEDCLYLNIWTPRPADGITLPVVVLLYTESWTNGGPTLPCQDLAAEGFVVVTVAYRLHLLSFFTLRSIAARGNLALLDQYVALLWIRDNIAAFGGDPTAITVIGHSAGADSVLHHLASPRSTGLFHRAIIMSPQSIWQIIDERKIINSSQAELVSRQVARNLGCTSDTDQEILNCMRALPLTNIISSYSNANWSIYMQPIQDDFLPESEQYLPNSLITSLSSTKQSFKQIDLLFGTTDLEALSYNDKKYEKLLKHNVSYISEYADREAIPEILRQLSFQELTDFTTLGRVIRWEYWNGKIQKNVVESVENLARMESAARWGAGAALLAAKLARRFTRLYVYRYSQPNGVDLYGKQYNFTGAVHGSDLVSLLGDTIMLQIARRPSTIEEKRTSSLFRKYFVNFIKHRSPDDEDLWQMYKIGDAQIHEIRNTESLSTLRHSATKETAFWLQYLPELSGLLSTSARSEEFNLEQGENRLRGGVFAMCGLSIGLLLLLSACAILLHRQRSRRYSVADNSLN